MFSSKYNVISLFLIFSLLTACGGGIGDVENTHPSQFAPKVAPELTTLRNSKNQLLLNWSEQKSAQSYTLYISDSADFADKKTTILDLITPPYLVSDLNVGIDYFVKITPNWKSKAGPASSQLKFKAPPLTPSNVTTTENSQITWANDGALHNVYWSKDPSFTIDKAEGSAKNIAEDSYQPLNEGYESDDVIYYYVTAVNQNIEGEISAKIEIQASKIITTDNSAPNNPKVIARDGTFSFDWQVSSLANTYSVYMAQDTGVTQNNAGSLTSGMIHTDVQNPFGHSLSNNDRFYLVVTSKNSESPESIESTEVSVKPKASQVGVPDEISIEADKDHLTISWDAVTDALSYNVYWSTTPDVTALTGELVPGAADTGNTSILHTSIQNGLMHYYVVTAISADGESEESAEVGAIPYGVLPPPSDITTLNTDQSATLTWPDVPGAVKYHLYMALDNNLTKENVESLNGWMKHTDNVTSPFVHPGLVNDLTYYMLLTSVDQFGAESAASVLFEVMPKKSDVVVPPQKPIELKNPIGKLTTFEDSEFNFQIPENTFSESETGIIAYSLTQADDSAIPNWLTFNADTRTLNGTPENKDVGTITLNLTATNNNNIAFDEFFIEVINTNDNPKLNKPTIDFTIVTNTELVLEIDEDTFIDEDAGDILSLTVLLKDGQALPSWISFDTTTKKVTFTPFDTEVDTSVNIEIIATDSDAATAEDLFKITVINSRKTPYAADDTPKPVKENESIIIDVLFNDLKANAVLDNTSIKIIDESTYGKTKLNSEGKITYKHDGSENFSDKFTYTVNDIDGITSNIATVTIIITEVNDAPIISGTPESSVDVNETYLFTPKAIDVDNTQDELTFFIKNKPTWATFESSTGELTGTPSSVDFEQSFKNIAIGVKDLALDDFLLPFEIQVTGVKPVAVDDPATILNTEDTIVINVSRNDKANGGSPINLASISIISNGKNGFASANEAGTISYKSNVSPSAPDSFTYTIKNDIGLESAPATVTITVIDNVVPFTSEDIGAVGVAGNYLQENGTHIINGSGTNIWNTSDEFHFAYKPLAGDIDISTRVFDIQNQVLFSKAGIMIRDSLDAGSKFAHLFVTFPTDSAKITETQVHLNIRTEDNQKSFNPTLKFNSLTNIPRYIRLTRRDNTFEAYESLDGKKWQIIATFEIFMGPETFVGLSVTSRKNDQLLKVSYDNLTLLNDTIPQPEKIHTSISLFEETVDTSSKYYHLTDLTPGETYNVEISSSNGEDINLLVFKDAFNNLECNSFNTTSGHDSCLATPNADGSLYVRVDGSYTTAGAKFSLQFNRWTGTDIGTSTPGSVAIRNEVFTIEGSGRDIFSTKDGFYFYYQKMQDDAEIIVEVTDQFKTNNWAKSGVMMRESLDANSPFVDVVVTPTPSATEGVRFQSRPGIEDNVLHNNTRTNGTAAPRWVKLIRRGDRYDAFEASHVDDWKFIGSTHFVMTSDLFVGLAVTASNDGQLSKAVFENLQVSNSPPPPQPYEIIAGPISSPLSKILANDDEFIKMTGLTPNIAYDVTIQNLEDDLDLYVYNTDFQDILCPDIKKYAPAYKPEYTSGTASETCSAVSTNNIGELFIRINGSYAGTNVKYNLSVK